MREEFVKRGILSALQVLMRYTEELTKANLPLLRKALDVVSFLPLTEEAIIRSRTGKCSFTFLLDLCRHHDQEAARRAGAISGETPGVPAQAAQGVAAARPAADGVELGVEGQGEGEGEGQGRDRPRIKEWRQDGGRPPSRW